MVSTIRDHRATTLAAVCPVRARPAVFAAIRKALRHKGFGPVRTGMNTILDAWQTG